jgi:hypothetical protein
MKQRWNIAAFVKKAYHAYFGMKFGDQDKTWAPRKASRTTATVDERSEKSITLWNTYGAARTFRPRKRLLLLLLQCERIQRYKQNGNYVSKYSVSHFTCSSRARNSSTFATRNPSFVFTVSDAETSGSVKSDSDFQTDTPAKEPQLLTQSELSDLAFRKT